jgi:CBS domain-containing protein
MPGLKKEVNLVITCKDNDFTANNEYPRKFGIIIGANTATRRSFVAHILVNLIYHSVMDKFTEEFKVKGEELVEKVRQLIHEGNVRRLIIKDEDGKVYLEIPVTFGMIGALIAPMLAAVGAVAAMVANLKIEVVRNDDPEKPV